MLPGQNSKAGMTSTAVSLNTDDKSSSGSNFVYYQVNNGGGLNPTGAGNLGASGALGFTLLSAPGTQSPSDLMASMLTPGIVGGCNGTSPVSTSNWPLFNTTTVSTNINKGLVIGNGRAAFVRS